MMGKSLASPILQLIHHVAGLQEVGIAPDHDLLAQFRNRGDGAAFHALVSRHGPMVFDACRGVLGNDADAEDAFQARRGIGDIPGCFKNNLGCPRCPHLTNWRLTVCSPAARESVGTLGVGHSW